MKVAILTHRLGYNYGGILQNWALQQVLKKMGCSPLTIDWEQRHYGWPDYIKAVLAVARRRLTGMTLQWPHTPLWRDPNLKGLQAFVRKHIKMSRCICLDKVPQYIKSKNFDAAIVGSDQVWRPKYIPQIENMFLPLEAEGRPVKIAYGASFGTDDWEFSDRQTVACTQWLKKFKAVSVREESAVRLCAEKLCFHDAEFVLDPTMLISKERYLELCNDIPSSQGGHVLVYCLDENDGVKKCAEAVSWQLELPIKVISGAAQAGDTVEGWIAAFRDARYVVTDSYHGTVFSLIFNRPFTTFYNHSRGNARFNTLASLFGIAERMQGAYVDNAIDWESVNATLCGKIQESLSFLKSSLSK